MLLLLQLPLLLLMQLLLVLLLLLLLLLLVCLFSVFHEAVSNLAKRKIYTIRMRTESFSTSANARRELSEPYNQDLNHETHCWGTSSNTI